MHALEKMLARASGRDVVETGEIVRANIDLVEVNDLYLQVVKSYWDLNGKKVWDPDKVTFVFDHYAPCPSMKTADNHKIMRKFCSEQGIEKLFDVGDGICHQVLVEEGLVKPGNIIVETDSHTTTLGAFGAFGTGVGSTDMAMILLEGKLWFKVPEIIKVEINGKLRSNVMAKDVILHIIGKLGQDAAVYKAIEFTGSTVRDMEIDERMVLCNMCVEMGAKATYIQPDQKTLRFLKDHGAVDFTIFETDEDFAYAQSYSFDVSELVPQVARPHSVDNVDDLASVAGEKIDQVFIGTCTGGRLNDISTAAKILENKQVAQGTRFIVIPASKSILKQSVERGYFQTLMESGAVFATPGCGPCLGVHQGVIASGESCASTSSRNFPGRMGSPKGNIFIVSPATASATAIAGKLASAPCQEEG